MANKKERVDVLLVERGLVDTREKARRSIMAGLVYSDFERIDKPGTKMDTSTTLYVKGEECVYVSRGGLKLEKAIQSFNLNLTDQLILDVGASTGGFTDCALQNGAKEVYAVDVGYNQLHWKLRSDERVHVMERMNFRYADAEDFTSGQPDFAVCDVSFISLKHIFQPMARILKETGQAVVLIKPQFEAGREEVGKKGIVRDAKIHKRVIQEVIDFAFSNQLYAKGLDVSPITGAGGNVEFLLYLSKMPTSNQITDQVIIQVVQDAHK
ncbi:TlyA family RNA methyltransferase [Geomicrobium sediminis]|uniref:23S rRNA (Cytidine1920-2'-O)/16S rRNA (Cytidine1409-2'-O)-methyltransferase n=1 Tax=Geomicrobium sediminis TaxID=1347788 RepID=A0ABS2PEF0_9BACL|nr:TlyA family RNA methyltransferase [Geomicrobium sediminis]MBM7633642.1 23S rRNA (cytidine1920-2'-O)/16S rRNA (cytidine1409-2'-O)-methyltransferase [Geomicrobium sediminis]